MSRGDEGAAMAPGTSGSGAAGPSGPGSGAGDGTAPLPLAAFAGVLRAPPVPQAQSWRPDFVRPAAGEVNELMALCEAHGVRVVDAMDRQLADLAAVRLPAASEAEREAYVRQLVDAAGGAGAFGTWVHLPWLGRLVHLLDRDDYFDVITNRNQDKLTRDEQRLLRTKRVGVMGLSVGGEAAVTLAQEHLCGHMLLADFDALDLSNLNRLGAGCDDLGLNKAVIVARRIVRIDPYLELTVLEDGVSADGLDDFLEGLDLILEECDDLTLKHTVRVAAKRHGVDMIFAGDERGFLSVEPYGLWPELAPFHGRVSGPQRAKSDYASPLAFLKALSVWLGGWDAISARSRSSLERVGETLCGYPQLAGEARYAAGQLANVARRLLLGERLPPFVGHLDLDALVPGGVAGGPASTRAGEREARADAGAGAGVPGAVDLTDAQRQHLRLALARLARDAEEMGRWSGSQPLDAGSRDRLAAILDAVGSRVRQLAARLDVSLYLEPEDPHRRLGAWASSWWSAILDCRPAALRGYGPVSDSARAVLAPEIDALAGLLMQVQDVVQARG